MAEAALGNQAAPSALRRGETDWRDDLLAYDLLPEELRLMIQDAPFEADAMGVLLAYRLRLRRFGSPLMALAATAGDLRRFMDQALATAQSELGPTPATNVPWPEPLCVRQDPCR